MIDLQLTLLEMARCFSFSLRLSSFEIFSNSSLQTKSSFIIRKAIVKLYKVTDFFLYVNRHSMVLEKIIPLILFYNETIILTYFQNSSFSLLNITCWKLEFRFSSIFALDIHLFYLITCFNKLF